MDKESRILHYLTILLLLAIVVLLVFANHQLDTIKHAVGGTESPAELQLHTQLGMNESAETPEHKEAEKIG